MKLFLDVETTGLDPENDEILSLTLIEYDYENNSFHTCMDLKFKPDSLSEWPDAEKINGISPASVSDCDSIKEYIKDIQQCVDECSEIVIYNVRFDSAFLENIGIDFSGKTFIDPMLSYAARYTSGKWMSLSYVYFDLLGHPFKNIHTSFGDTLALIEVTMILYPQSFRVDAFSSFEFFSQNFHECHIRDGGSFNEEIRRYFK